MAKTKHWYSGNPYAALCDLQGLAQGLLCRLFLFPALELCLAQHTVDFADTLNVAGALGVADHLQLAIFDISERAWHAILLVGRAALRPALLRRLQHTRSEVLTKRDLLAWES
eukprot:CAMPEP_0180686768 /NCGR_PEP_ID=MMETSP1037_2-20121125/73095_1 /TAXON_ID=632150 /ORGANISM="Azadinium spinosum, Strain 3D9" /LENGTH=112 /DNA_ID=CAMNT_0022717507 /DNA_START=141 /DNA_END=475 /DNA_ORIENTATION=-